MKTLTKTTLLMALAAVVQLEATSAGADRYRRTKSTRAGRNRTMMVRRTQQPLVRRVGNTRFHKLGLRPVSARQSRGSFALNPQSEPPSRPVGYFGRTRQQSPVVRRFGNTRFHKLGLRPISARRSRGSAALNPQSEPPSRPGSRFGDWVGLNPQPEPPSSLMQFEIQRLMSRFNQAEGSAASVNRRSNKSKKRILENLK